MSYGSLRQNVTCKILGINLAAARAIAPPYFVPFSRTNSPMGVILNSPPRMSYLLIPTGLLAVVVLYL
jgi:hypothetical protein